MDIQPNDLYNLLYGFEEFSRCQIKSVDRRDSTLTVKVRIIPFGLGSELRTLDPDEKYFHVELIGQSPARAELWHAGAYRESLTRYYKFRPPPEESPTPLTTKIAMFEQHLVHTFRGRGVPLEHARATAEYLIRGPDVEGLLNVFPLFPPDDRTLNDIRAELASAGEPQLGDILKD